MVDALIGMAIQNLRLTELVGLRFVLRRWTATTEGVNAMLPSQGVRT